MKFGMRYDIIGNESCFGFTTVIKKLYLFNIIILQ